MCPDHPLSGESRPFKAPEIIDVLLKGLPARASTNGTVFVSQNTSKSQTTVTPKSYVSESDQIRVQQVYGGYCASTP